MENGVGILSGGKDLVFLNPLLLRLVLPGRRGLSGEVVLLDIPPVIVFLHSGRSLNTEVAQDTERLVCPDAGAVAAADHAIGGLMVSRLETGLAQQEGAAVEVEELATCQTGSAVLTGGLDLGGGSGHWIRGLDLGSGSGHWIRGSEWGGGDVLLPWSERIHFGLPLQNGFMSPRETGQSSPSLTLN